MTNIKENNELHKQKDEKQIRKEDTRISVTYIVIIVFLLVALLIYIYFKPHKPTSVNNPELNQTDTVQ